MAYTEQTWADGPSGGTPITADALNHIEGGIAAAAAAAAAPTSWSAVTGKPAVIAAGANQSEARSAIGAGTSSLAIGTTASTAKAGNYTPSTSEVSNSLKAKSQISALTAIADPSTATAEDIATAVNAIIAALKA